MVFDSIYLYYLASRVSSNHADFPNFSKTHFWYFDTILKGRVAMVKWFFSSQTFLSILFDSGMKINFFRMLPDSYPSLCAT